MKEIPVIFKNKRGKCLIGIIHFPSKKRKPLEALIICPGFLKTKTDVKFVKLARFLARYGFLTLRFDFEGCGDSQGDPKEITVKRQAEDLFLIFQKISSLFKIKSNNISLLGESLGGAVIALFLKKYFKKISQGLKSLIFWAPAFNQKKLLKKWYSSKETKEIIKKGFLTKKLKIIGKKYFLENKDKDYGLYLLDFNIPVLICQGEKDEDVPLKLNKELFQKLKSKKKMVIIKKANHKFDDFSSLNLLFKETIAWLLEKK